MAVDPGFFSQITDVRSISYTIMPRMRDYTIVVKDTDDAPR